MAGEGRPEGLRYTSTQPRRGIIIETFNDPHSFIKELAANVFSWEDAGGGISVLLTATYTNCDIPAPSVD